MTGKIPKKSKDNITKILSNLDKKMREIDSMKKELEQKHSRTISPEQSRSLLEEIKVPALTLIKENRHQKNTVH